MITARFSKVDRRPLLWAAILMVSAPACSDTTTHPARPEPSAVPGEIQGEVRSDETGLPEARLVLSGPKLDSTLSDSDGSFAFEALASGQYTVVVRLPEGYAAVGDTSVETTVSEGETSHVSFSARLVISAPGLAFKVEPAGVAPENRVFPAGQKLYPPVVVSVPADYAGTVSVFLGSNGCKGTLTGGDPVSPVHGEVTFSDLVMDEVCDGYTLEAAGDGVQSTESRPFDITVPGDLNLDAFVDEFDLGNLLARWQHTDYPPADINKDGVVDTSDQGVVISDWTGDDLLTGEATSITVAGAELHGTVTATEAVIAWFEYSTDPAFATYSSSSQSTVAQGTEVPVNSLINGLSPGQTYYVRLAARRGHDLGRAPIQDAVSFTAQGTQPEQTASNQ